MRILMAEADKSLPLEVAACSFQSYLIFRCSPVHFPAVFAASC